MSRLPDSLRVPIRGSKDDETIDILRNAYSVGNSLCRAAVAASVSSVDAQLGGTNCLHAGGHVFRRIAAAAGNGSSAL